MKKKCQAGGETPADDIEARLARLVELGADDDVFRPCDVKEYRMPWPGCSAYALNDGRMLLSKKAAELFGADALSAVSEPVKLDWDGIAAEGHAVKLKHLVERGHSGWRGVITDWFRQRVLGAGDVVSVKTVEATVGGDILIGTLAKLLCQRGAKTGQNRLFAWMRDMGYLCRRSGEMHNMPSQSSVERGLFRISLGLVEKSDGTVVATRTVRVTPKGVDYFLGMPAGAFAAA